MKKLRRAGTPTEHWLGYLLVLAVFFLAGVILGQVLAARTATGADSELYRYLSDFFQIDSPPGDAALLSSLRVYLRYPVLAFLLGFASVGLVLLPVVSVAFGFFLSFSVCCFASAFGGNGILLALSVFGLRCAVTLPCYFFLAIPAFRAAVSLAMLSFGNGKRIAPVTYGASYFLRFCICVVILIAGVLVELSLSPHLLHLVCVRIFQ
ncbi:MAG: hypothetical protein RRY95_03105 [Oscillospiraceae bacterium]